MTGPVRVEAAPASPTDVNVTALAVSILYRHVFRGEEADLSAVDPSELPSDTIVKLWRAARQLQEQNAEAAPLALAELSGISPATLNQALDPQYECACRSAAEGVRRLAAETTGRRERRAAELAVEQLADRIAEGKGLSEARRVVQHLEAAEAAASRRLEPVDLTAWRESQPTPWLVEGLLAAGSVSMVSGAAGASKSMLALIAALRLGGADLDELLGIFDTSEDPVSGAVFDAECGRRRLSLRIRELVEGEQLLAENVDSALERIAIFTPEVIPNRAEVLGALPALIEEHGWRFVVLDPLRSFLPPDLESENDNIQIGRTMDRLVEIAAQTGVAILVLDHDSKSGGAARGASVKGDAVATLWHLERPDAEDEDYLQLTNLKSRDPASTDRVVALQRIRKQAQDGRHPLRFEATAVRKPGEASGQVAAAAIAVKECLTASPQTQSELIAALESEFPRTTVRRAIASLESGQVIGRTGEKRKRSPLFELKDHHE